jgi:hypothetical protein
VLLKSALFPFVQPFRVSCSSPKSPVAGSSGFIVPYIINPDAANLGAKIAYIFFGMGVIFSILLYLYIPETKGLSFEDVTPTEIVLILVGLFVLDKNQPEKVPASHQEPSF